jgi:hypothetical protein
MKDFDAKWQQCAAQARQAEPRDETMPLGFAHRIVARAFAHERVSLESLWERFALRTLAGAAGVLLFTAVFELPHMHDSRPLEPGLANTVAQIVWSL